MIDKKELLEIKQRFSIIGDYEGLNHAIETALQIARTEVSVLVTGESGVGKEVFPQIIHRNSARKHGPYIAVNCGAIPEGTIDSELFGHKKGSFTDAVSERKGYFEVSDGGTIFLDEIGELPLPTQARLLRVLESGEFMKVGSSEIQKTDIRVVAATNVDLLKAIKNKRFRQDLYYRLNTVTIELPPLRDRGGDILLLFRKFAADFADKYRMPPVRPDAEAERVLQIYRWPGNIRELRNLVERLSVIAEDRTIGRDMLLSQLPSHALSRLPAVVQQRRDEFSATEQEVDTAGSKGIPNDILYKMLLDLKMEISHISAQLQHYEGKSSQRDSTYLEPVKTAMPHLPSLPPLNSHLPPKVSASEETDAYEEMLSGDSPLSLDEMEQKYITDVLAANEGNRKKTAAELKISERTLYRKLKDYQID